MLSYMSIVALINSYRKVNFYCYWLLQMLIINLYLLLSMCGFKSLNYIYLYAYKNIDQMLNVQGMSGGVSQGAYTLCKGDSCRRKPVIPDKLEQLPEGWGTKINNRTTRRLEIVSFRDYFDRCRANRRDDITSEYRYKAFSNSHQQEAVTHNLFIQV